MRKGKPLRTFRVTFVRVTMYARIKAASPKEARVIAEDHEARGELDAAGPFRRLLPEGREIEKEAWRGEAEPFIADIEEVP